MVSALPQLQQTNYKINALILEGHQQRLFPSMLNDPLDKFPCALARVTATLSVVLRTSDDSFYMVNIITTLHHFCLKKHLKW